MTKSRKFVVTAAALGVIMVVGGMSSLTPQAAAFFPTKKSTVTYTQLYKDLVAFNTAYAKLWGAAAQAIYPPFTGNYTTYAATVKTNYSNYITLWKTINSQLPAVWSATSNATYFAAWDSVVATVNAYVTAAANANLTTAFTNFQTAYATLKADFL